MKEGLLYKRGEYIRNWRPRWFQLRSDGSFRGYKTKPLAGDGQGPINFFDVAGSVLSVPDDALRKKSDKYWGFTVRFMQMTRFVERNFHCETAKERDEWVEAYDKVKKSVTESSSVSNPASVLAPVASPAAGKTPDTPSSSADAPVQVDSVSIDDFELQKVLGKGTFGKVMLARHKETKMLYAIKVLKKDVILAKDEITHTLTENAVLASCRHPFLTSLEYSFQTPELLCFVMEYVNGGELFFHLSRDKKFGEDRAKFYIAEIVHAMTYLHERHIIYRDLKLENLLLDSDGHIKITDFGLCKQEMDYSATTSTFCGTPEYLAPEVLEDADYTTAVDWWGVGVVMYEMICGHLPFYNRNHEVLFDLILHEEIRFPPSVSPKAKLLLSSLLQKDPRARLGSGERDGLDIQDHEFFSDIDFEKLYRKEIAPPYVPEIKRDDDVSNFDPMFTTEKAQFTPPEDASISNDTEAQEMFKKFDDLAPNK